MLPTSVIKTRYESSTKERLCQGDILLDLNFSYIANQGQTEAPVSVRYGIVMNQDCDLERDQYSRNDTALGGDKLLPSILVCPAYVLEIFLKGEHLKPKKMQEFLGPKDKDKLAKNNELNRYHFLSGDARLKIPDLVIDFKHFYTIPTEILYAQFNKSYLITINELFRERLSQRFANYLSRFGLPEFRET